MYGEVYNVDDQCLQWLDDFEGHPTHYQRDKVQVRILSRASNNSKTDPTTMKCEQDTDECWVYYVKKFDSALLSLETYSSYDAFGEHKRLYIYKYVVYFLYTMEIALATSLVGSLTDCDTLHVIGFVGSVNRQLLIQHVTDAASRLYTYCNSNTN